MPTLLVRLVSSIVLRISERLLNVYRLKVELTIEGAVFLSLSFLRSVWAKFGFWRKQYDATGRYTDTGIVPGRSADGPACGRGARCTTHSEIAASGADRQPARDGGREAGRACPGLFRQG